MQTTTTVDEVDRISQECQLEIIVGLSVDEGNKSGPNNRKRGTRYQMRTKIEQVDKFK